MRDEAFDKKFPGGLSHLEGFNHFRRQGWDAALADGRKPMACGHRQANWFHPQSEDAGCCLVCQAVKQAEDAAWLEAAKAICDDCREGRSLNPIWNDVRKQWDFFHDDESGDNICGCSAEAIHRL